jgi:cytochrome c oxidase assembly protein subunit 19
MMKQLADRDKLLDRNLMAPDNFQNLGLVFKDEEGKNQTLATPAANASETGNKS